MKYLIISLSFILVSCSMCFKDHEIDNTNSPTEPIKEAIKIAGDSPEIIKKSATKSENSIKEIEMYIKEIWNTGDLNESQQTSMKKLEVKVQELKEEISIIKDNNFKVISSYDWIRKAAEMSEKRDQQFGIYKQKAQDASIKSKENFDNKLQYTIIGAAILIAICIVSGINGSRQAWGFAIGGIVLIVVCTTLMYHDKDIGFYGYVAGGITLALVAVKVKRDFDDRKATEEIIHSNEIIKNELSEEKRKEIFGDGAKPGILNGIQSKSTEARVLGVRKKKKDNWTKII